MAAAESDPFRGADGRADAKVELMRRRNAERVARLLNARERTIGIDKTALQAQVEERRELAREDAAEAAAYAEYEARLLDVVASREARDEARAKDEFDQLKAEWGADAEARSKRDAEAKTTYAVDPERCGTAAAQKFRGEDPSRLERQKLQGATTQCWLAQQIAEKVARRDEEKDEDARYAAYEAFVAESRGDLEGEEEAARFELRRALAAANARDAEERADAKVAGIEASRALERQEISARLVDPELIETTSVARSALGAHRYRPDHFKGLSTEQVKAILAENETIAADNMASKNAERRFDDEYDFSQTELLRLAHEDEENYQAAMRGRAKMLEDELVSQRDVERERIRKSRADRFGHVAAGGYLDGFGKSAR